VNAPDRIVVEQDLHAAALRRVWNAGGGLVLVPTLFESVMAAGPVYVAESWRRASMLQTGVAVIGARLRYRANTAEIDYDVVDPAAARGAGTAADTDWRTARSMPSWAARTRFHVDTAREIPFGSLTEEGARRLGLLRQTVKGAQVYVSSKARRRGVAPVQASHASALAALTEMGRSLYGLPEEWTRHTTVWLLEVTRA
jgi:hypothetical protein